VELAPDAEEEVERLHALADLHGREQPEMCEVGKRRQAVPRPGVLTDNGHPLLDVRGLAISDPPAMEREINQWPGVVSVGIFARHRASVCLLGTAAGVQTLSYD
jgi:ribose 5-phosphate isomerase